MKDYKTILQALYRFFVGAVFGFANIIPGVSGGTAMVVFGMYERIILLITDFFKRIRTEWKFFLPIVLGMGASIFLFGSIMDVLLTDHQALTQLFFIGVIVFSAPMILKKAAAGARNVKTDVTCAVLFALVLALMIVLAGADRARVEPEEVALTGGWLAVSLKMLACGAIACATMIIPGISGSLVMVMLGVYGEIMAALHAFDILQLLPFGIGMLIGLVFCAKLIKLLLARFSRQAYSAILGFVIGSIFTVFPGWAHIDLPGVIAFLIGGGAIIACELLAKRAEA